MQGGEPGPGQRVYVVRRIVAALVILLLLVLFVPWACQALFPERESGSRAPETAATDEDTVVEEQASIPDGSPGDGGSEVESGTLEITSDSEADGGGETLNLEVAADLTGVVVTGLEAAVGEGDIVGGANETAPVLAIDNQPPAEQPIAQEQPVQPIAQPPAEQPIAQGLPVQPMAFEEPIFFGGPALFGEPFFFEPPFFLEEPFFFEDGTVPGEIAGGAMDTVTANDAPVIADSGGPVAVTGIVVAIS